MARARARLEHSVLADDRPADLHLLSECRRSIGEKIAAVVARLVVDAGNIVHRTGRDAR